MLGHPIKSMLQINGFIVLGSNPAMTGSMKYGPKRCSYKKLDNIEANLSGCIVLFSRISYIFLRNIRRLYTVKISDCSPANPIYICLLTGNTFSKLVAIVCA